MRQSQFRCVDHYIIDCNQIDIYTAVGVCAVGLTVRCRIYVALYRLQCRVQFGRGE